MPPNNTIYLHPKDIATPKHNTTDRQTDKMAAVNPFAVADVMDELKKVFENKAYRRAMCDAVLKRSKTTCDKWDMWHFTYATHLSSGCSGVHTAFGSYNEREYSSTGGHWRTQYLGKGGVEVVGLRPLAMKSTYSQFCNITNAELKKACKDNGIKVLTTWKKVQLLQALMKV